MKVSHNSYELRRRETRERNGIFHHIYQSLTKLRDKVIIDTERNARNFPVLTVVPPNNSKSHNYCHEQVQQGNPPANHEDVPHVTGT